jgi:hypothetical protein
MNKVQQLIVLAGLAAFVTSITLFTSENDAFAIQFSNYTSEKYGIQFEYPSDWELTEKISRFDSGADIDITSNGTTSISMLYGDDGLEYGYGSADIETATLKFYNDLIDLAFGYEFKSIEKPSFITIDGQKTGTFLFTMEEKYKDVSPKLAVQQWITFVGDIGYSFTFTALTGSFDNPENMEIRDHFIKSLKFLGDKIPTTTTSNSTSRFD